MPAAVRKQILEYLRSNRCASVSEIAASLDVTRADVRYHLKALLDERLIRAADAPEMPKRSGRGRPAQRFQLTGRSLPDNNQMLASALLRLYMQTSGRTPQETAAELAATVFDAPQISSMPLFQGLFHLITELNQRHYDAHWEAHRSGPQIFFENCPYASILSEFPLLCEMDRQFISRSAGVPAEQLKRIDKSRRKPPACLFRLIIE